MKIGDALFNLITLAYPFRYQTPYSAHECLERLRELPTKPTGDHSTRFRVEIKYGINDCRFEVCQVDSRDRILGPVVHGTIDEHQQPTLVHGYAHHGFATFLILVMGCIAVVNLSRIQSEGLQGWCALALWIIFPLIFFVVDLVSSRLLMQEIETAIVPMRKQKG